MSESSSPELSVVCKNCGAENSPYVTECPYCGNRLRRRAPKLERVGDEVRVQETRRDKSRRKAAERKAKRRRSADARALFEQSVAVPWVAIVLIALPAVALVIATGASLFPSDLGAIIGTPSIDTEPWRYVAGPFVYDEPGYLFACGLAIAIFLGGVERRVGIVPAALLALASGALGMLGAVAIEGALGTDVIVAGGGNGIALGSLGAWWVMRSAERRADPGEEPDQWTIAIVVSAAVLLALPALVDLANVWAGLVGGAVGLVLGGVALAGRRRDG